MFYFYIILFILFIAFIALVLHAINDVFTIRKEMVVIKQQNEELKELIKQYISK